jgi:DNA-binding transcriptional LysR family regulator
MPITPVHNTVSRRVKLNDLHILMVVVQAGSMNRAAGLLNSTQPAISRSIKELERVIGVPLLDRTPRGVEPTLFGRAMLDGGAAMFDDLHQTLQNIKFLKDPTTGSVRVGCSPLLAATVVAAVIERMSRSFPRMRFDLLSAPVEVVHRELNERRLDLVVTRQAGPIVEEQIEFVHLFDDSLVAVCGRKHPLARRRKLTLPDLVSESWALPPPDLVLGEDVLNGFRKHGLEPPVPIVVTVSPEARMSLVAHGRFITIFPESALRFSGKRADMSILPVKLPTASVPVGIATLRKRAINPVARLFLEHAREITRPLVRRSS